MSGKAKTLMACNATLCVHNDFGYCVMENPHIVGHHLTGDICLSHSPDKLCEAAETYDALKFIHV